MTFPPASTLVGRILRAPLRFVPRHRAVRILSGPLAGKHWIPSSATHGCWLGTYERELQQLLVSNLRPGDVFFDLGANVGFFTLIGSVRVGPTGTVVAFEPLPRNVALLRQHLDQNNVSNTVVITAAVADAEGTGCLFESGSPSMCSLGAEGIGVPVVTLDKLVNDGTIPPPSVMKIDVEGAEERVLTGAYRLLTTAFPLIFLSAHGYRQHEACRDYLSELGYELQLRRDGNRDGQYEVTAKHPAAVV